MVMVPSKHRDLEFAKMVAFSFLFCCGCLLSFLALPAVAETEASDYWLPDFRENGAYSKAAASVRSSLRWGFIDKQGKFVIEPIYSAVTNFDCGKAGKANAQKNGKLLKIDRSGKVVQPDINYLQAYNDAYKHSWAQNEKRAAKKQKPETIGDIYDRSGLHLIALRKNVHLGKVSEGLSYCYLSEKAAIRYHKLCPSKKTDKSSKALGLTGYMETDDPKDWGKNRYCYVNTLGRIIIPPRFSRATDFEKGLAKVERTMSGIKVFRRVSEREKTGLIDRKGRLIGGRYFDGMCYEPDLKFNHFRVFEKGDWSKAKVGFISKDGKELVGNYTDCKDFSNGLAAVKGSNGKWGFIDREGKQIVAPKYDDVGGYGNYMSWIKVAGKYGFIDSKGKLTIEPRFPNVDDFCCGMAPVAVEIPLEEKEEMLSKQLEWKCGFINPDGKVVIPAAFASARKFSEGLCAVQKGLYWGFIDKAGTCVIKPSFDEARDFSEGLAAVLKDGKWFFIDREGNTSLKLEKQTEEICLREHPRSFSEGVTLVQERDSYWHFIDRSGKEIIPESGTRFSLVDYTEDCLFSEGLAGVQTSKTYSNRFGYIDHKGVMQIEPKFGKVKQFSEGFALVAKFDTYPAKYGYIRKNGDWLIEPVYDNAGSFKEGLAPVAVGTRAYVPRKRASEPSILVSQELPSSIKLIPKWGFIDTTGNIAIKQKFEDAREFSEGLAAVKENGFWGFIDRNGEYVIKPKFEFVDSFSSGRALVRVADKYGYIDKEGELAIEPTHWLSCPFSNGLAMFVSPTDKSKTVSTGPRWCFPVKSKSDVVKYIRGFTGAAGQ